MDKKEVEKAKGYRGGKGEKEETGGKEGKGQKEGNGKKHGSGKQHGKGGGGEGVLEDIEFAKKLGRFTSQVRDQVGLDGRLDFGKFFGNDQPVRLEIASGAGEWAAAQVLQCVAACCGVLQWVTVCCSVLQCAVGWLRVVGFVKL